MQFYVKSTVASGAPCVYKRGVLQNLLVLTEGEVDGEAVWGGAGASDGATMEQDGILNNSQSQTCTALIAASTFIYAIKTFAEIWQMFFSYTYTIIRYAEIKHAGFS